jgi:RPA family protein
MISKKEFIVGSIILFIAFIFVNSLMVSDMKETMAMLKRPVVLHDTTSVMRYVDRYIHDTVYTTIHKTEYIEKVSLIGKMQDYAEEKGTVIKIETEENLLEFDAQFVKIQCNGKLIPDEDGDLNTCAGDWVITAKEELE